ncbi:hypothetical protein O9993_17590 [Vibrio lentus]|nr:hypothetical protein [Vibrio lentus]
MTQYIQSTEAGLAMAEPGRTTGDVWQNTVMVGARKERGGGNDGNGSRNGSRLRHAVNLMAITCAKWGCDKTRGSMVLTLEPGMAFAKRTA